MTYMLDTCIISAILNGNEKVKKKAQKTKFGGEKISINGICYYEIKRGLLAVNARTKLAVFDVLCRAFELVLLDDLSIFDRAAEIYADLRPKGEPHADADILIASIAISRDSILVTGDTDFNPIQGLKIENWLT